MRIEYIVQARMPTEKAHGLQIAYMCEALADLGHEVRLVVPQRENPITESVFSYYGVRENFRVTYLSCIDLVSKWGHFGAIVYWLHAMLFVGRLVVYRPSKDTLIYTRSPEIAWLYKLRGYRVVCEVHDWPESKVEAFTWLLWDVDLLPCNSEGTETASKAHGLVRTMVAHNAIDEEVFLQHFDKNETRRTLGISESAKVVMYIGSLEKWKGVEILAAAAAQLNPDVETVIIGGPESKVRELSARYPKARFLGPRPFKDLAHNQSAADVLVVPNIPESVESQEYTSPIKLFSYLASGIPVVVSDLPSLRRIAGEYAWFFRAEDADALVATILTIFEKPEEAASRADKAKEAMRSHTWKGRAKSILARLENE